PCGTPLRRDEHNAVCASGSINGCGRRVLEYFDGGDVVRTDVADISRHEGDTVDNIERLVGRFERTSAAHPYDGKFARFEVWGDVNTCGLTLKGLKEVLGRPFLYNVRSHAGQGSRHVALLHRTIPYNHNFVALRDVLN